MGEPAENISVAAQKAGLEIMLKKLEGLPTLPTIVYELNRIVNNPMSSATEVSKVMEKDVSLTAKVLTLINSAYYAIPGGVANLQRAIAYLGYDVINQLVISATAFKNLNKSKDSEFDLPGFWKHSIGVAMASETLAKWLKHKSPPDCFTAGLLHDLGKIALYNVDNPALERVVDLATKENLTVYQAEIKMGVVPHPVIGAMLGKMWKLPSLVEKTILYHHEWDIKKRDVLSPEINQTIDTVIVANAIIHQLKFGASGHVQSETVTEPILKRLNIAPVQLPLMVKDVNRSLENAENFLKIIEG